MPSLVLIRALPGAPTDFDFDVLLGCDVLSGCTMELDWDRSASRRSRTPV
jgi:hypothetical protein